MTHRTKDEWAASVFAKFIGTPAATSAVDAVEDILELYVEIDRLTVRVEALEGENAELKRESASVEAAQARIDESCARLLKRLDIAEFGCSALREVCDKLQAENAALKAREQAGRDYLVSLTGIGSEDPMGFLIASHAALREQREEIAVHLVSEVTLLKAQVAEREWRPIESAPRDGTHVLLFGFFKDDRPTIGFFLNRNWFAWIHPDLPMTHVENPTHWMPLPVPPNTTLTKEPDNG